MNTKVRLRVTNQVPSAQTLVLEPWTTEYKLDPGESLDIVAEGDVAYPLQVELIPGQVILHSFDSKGAMMTVVPTSGGAR